MTLYYHCDNVIETIKLEVKILNTLFEILPLLVPVLLIDIAIVAVLLLFGPIIYFVFGKGENE